MIWKDKETEHYIFNYKAGSKAEKEIQQIIELQVLEEAFIAWILSIDYSKEQLESARKVLYA